MRRKGDTPELTDAQLRALYVEHALTIRVIAERYQIDARTVSVRLKQLGIPSRRKGYGLGI